VSEATSAVADFDGYSPDARHPEPQPEPIAPQPEPQAADHRQPEASPALAQDETAQEAERAARRRSTVREKVSFAVNTQPAEAPAVAPASAEPEPAAVAPASQPSASEAETDTQPRRAGWWSRRFGNGE
jgi:ribonuclease E